MKRPLFIIIVAGGSGTRMGTAIPKQFIELGGKPILMRTVERMNEAFPDAEIITVLPEVHFETWKQLCLKHDFNSKQTLIKGGLTRFHSVKAALDVVPDGAIAAIHDGVRPFASTGMLRGIVNMLVSSEARAAVPAIPVADSLKFSDGTLPEPDRSGMVAVQTPQCFLSEDIKAAYRQPYDKAFTDDMSVAVRAGIKVDFFRGERANIKLTTPEDLTLAHYLPLEGCE